MSSKNTQKYNRKKAFILSAAVRVFNETGLGDTTITKLAASAGLAKTSVTYYYKRKEDLIAACYRDTFEKLEDIVTQVDSTQAPTDRLRQFINRYFIILNDIATEQATPFLSFGHLRALDEPIRSEFFGRYVDLFRSLRNLIQPVNFEDSDRWRLKGCARFLLNQIHWCVNWAGRYPGDRLNRAAEQFADILIKGVNPSGVEWSEPPGMEHKKPSQAKEIFLQKATELINEMGYRGASLEKIATRLERTKGSFYHHYTNKDELVIACSERTFTTVSAILGHTSMAGSRADCLRGIISNLVRFQLDPAGPLLPGKSLQALPSEKRIPITDRFSQLAKDLTDLIIDGIIDGSIRPVDPNIAAQMLVSNIFSSPEIPLWFPDVTIDKAATFYVRPFFDGLFK